MTDLTLPVGSAIPGTVSAFMTLASQTLPAGTTVWFGEELATYNTPLTLQITEVQGTQVPAEIGQRYRREETFSLICLLTYFQGGQQMVSLLDTVMSNFQLLALAVGNNPQLVQPSDTVQPVRFCQVGNFIISPVTDPNGLSAVTLSFALQCAQRVESLS